jgi:phosphoesterase RecJ-like protein
VTTDIKHSTKYPEAAKIAELLKAAQHIVIVQADNPDGDSLASALALEQILGDMGKEPYLYGAVNVPTYLRYLPGWDRVEQDLPKQFDLSIVVDTSADDLLGGLQKSGQKSWLAAKPSIVLDHHATKATIQFATVICNPVAVATSEVIYELAQQLSWPLNPTAKEMIAVAIMSDSLGLSTESTTGRSIHVIGELVENGVSLTKLDNARRLLMKKSPQLITYKGELLQRIEYFNDQKIATITIPWEEIVTYSPLYNPSMLVIDDMRMTENTELAIAFKVYKDGKVTAKIRANFGTPIAGKLAEAFGGGGHAYSSGFKVTDGRLFEDIKKETLNKAAELLNETV